MSSPGGLSLRLAAAATVAACLSMAACASPATPTIGGRTLRLIHISADSVQSPPPAGSPAEAHALAAELLTRLPLPAGARRLPPNPTPQSVDPALWGGAAAAFDVHELFKLPEPITSAAAFLAAHVPRGLYLSVTGRGTGLVGTAGALVAYTEVAFEPRSVPAGISAAQLVLTIATDASGGSLARVDAQVIWYLPRSAAEYIDAARYHALTVAVTIFNPLRTITKVVTSSADLAQLADALNGSQVQPVMYPGCPMAFAMYRLAFTIAPHRAPAVVVTAARWPCEGAQITVLGHKQPPLRAEATVVAIADRLLGFTPRP